MASVVFVIEGDVATAPVLVEGGASHVLDVLGLDGSGFGAVEARELAARTRRMLWQHFRGDAGRDDYARLHVLAEQASRLGRYVLYSTPADPGSTVVVRERSDG